MNSIHQHGMVASHLAIWESSQYSDMIVRCGSQEFKMHRAIVCPRSKFFATACNGQYQESQTGIIELKEDDSSTVHRMLQYIYTLDYDDSGENASLEHYMPNPIKDTKALKVELSEAEMEQHNQLINNVAVYAISDKYDVTELKELARTRFAALLLSRKLCADVFTLIDAVFETTPSTNFGLRDVAVDFCTRRVDPILSDPRYEGMFKDHGELGLGMLRRSEAEALRLREEKRNLVRKLKNQVFSLLRLFPMVLPSKASSQYAFDMLERSHTHIQTVLNTMSDGLEN